MWGAPQHASYSQGPLGSSELFNPFPTGPSLMGLVLSWASSSCRSVFFAESQPGGAADKGMVFPTVVLGWAGLGWARRGQAMSTTQMLPSPPLPGHPSSRPKSSREWDVLTGSLRSDYGWHVDKH